MAKRIKTDRLANLRAKRDELAALIDKEPAGLKRDRGLEKLADIDRRLARLERKKFIPPFVLSALLALIVAAIQWWLSSFWYASSGSLLWL